MNDMFASCADPSRYSHIVRNDERRASRMHRGQKNTEPKMSRSPAQAETAQDSDRKESKARSRDLASISAPD